MPASSYVPHPDDQRVLAQVDPDEIVGTLTDLVAIPSVDGTPAELDVQRWCAERMQDLGADVDRWDIDVADLARDPDFPGMEVERNQAIGCVGVWGGHAGTPALALYGHTDVVPPGDLWPGRATTRSGCGSTTASPTAAAPVT